ncbi:hypothetical protein [Tamlana sp. I1]|uniref:hypothetical protein n=1 Tax=Tamlana sp. I1 TaxID=2762061 RepID=UPI00188FC6A3|nr:hypothetical protein [Tamlana sp. I1]
MKNYIYLLILGVSLCSCNQEGWRSVSNSAPSVPEQIYPSDNLLCLEETITFRWEASTDIETKNLEYEVLVATDPGFTDIVQSVQDLMATEVSLTLEENKAYYWKVRSVDGELTKSDYSSTFQFYTEGIGVSNHLPFAPLLISPEMDEMVAGTTATLEWNAKDVDGDDLTYDVYFGTDATPMAMISENQAETTIDVAITSGETYHWKVVVADAHNEKTIGSVWSFMAN